jgi:nondiscriminating glutamyl-tRNA synthetase
MIKTRIAPSPTGFAHVGTLRGALYNYIFAKRNNGSFVLRIEDTDQNRLVEGALEDVVKTLCDFGLTPDEGPIWQDGEVVEVGDLGPYTQSRRLDLYGKYAQELIDKKSAYYCFCSQARLDELRKSLEAQKKAPRYDKHCLKLSAEEIAAKLSAGENHVIRLNVPADQDIRFTDLVHGEIKISTNDVDDQILMKSDGFPTYHLAVVVDDYLMKITHVLRGDEWLPSTPKHILLYSAFGWPSPQYAHLPLLLSTTKKKLSKREGDVAVRDFITQGYLPEALINFVALLGWNPKTEQEIFSLDELVKEFKLENINKSGAVFDLNKLDWLNGMYIRQMDLDELWTRTEPYFKQAGLPYGNFPVEFNKDVLKLEQERLKKLSEIGERVKYFYEDPDLDSSKIPWAKSTKEKAKANLLLLEEWFGNNLSDEKFNSGNIETEFTFFMEKNNLSKGELLWPLRYLLTGLEASPSPYEILSVFGTLKNGKDIVLKRIRTAIEKL